MKIEMKLGWNMKFGPFTSSPLRLYARFRGVLRHLCIAERRVWCSEPNHDAHFCGGVGDASRRRVANYVFSHATDASARRSHFCFWDVARRNEMLDTSQVDDLVSRVHAQYDALRFKPSSELQFTVLAAFVLSKPSCDVGDSGSSELTTTWKVISIATGSKCLPTEKYPVKGDALHDSHAEVLSRRGAIRWMYEEIRRCLHTSSGSAWIEKRETNGKWTMKEGVKLHMYVSTIPCTFIASTAIFKILPLASETNCFCRWRRVHALPCIRSGPRHGCSQGLLSSLTALPR